MSHVKLSTPPKKNEIEITLLGPGYGESILVHLGNNKWVIIDSCIQSKTLEPAPLEYFKTIGVNPETSVELIIATHWHDDHVRGISKVLSACPNAKFCHSVALRDKQFLNYVFTFGERNPISSGAGTNEWINVLKITDGKTLTKAIENRKVHCIPKAESGHGEECSVYTLSPSDKHVDLFLKSIAKLIPGKETKHRSTQPEDNDQSVVAMIEIGDISILLGGDLPETKDDETGWSVIVKSKERPQKKASVFKLPHHGSENAHNSDVWSQMLLDQPYAILTPYNGGPKKRPSPSDITRIESYTPNGYSSAKLSSSKTVVSRETPVERTIKETVGKIRKVQPHTGMIRLRKLVGKTSSWAVELFENACELTDVYK